LVSCVTSVFLHPTRATRARLFQSSAVASSASSADNFPNNLFNYFNIEGAGPYSILGFNSAKITYPPTVAGNGLVSSSSFAIDPARKMLVFNQGESGNQYGFFEWHLHHPQCHWRTQHPIAVHLLALCQLLPRSAFCQ